MEERDQYKLSKEMSLREVLDSPEFQFPIIVQTCGNPELNKRPCDDEYILPVDMIIKLEKETEVNYACLKVMPLENEKDTNEKEGVEFTVEYKGFVDEDILIPMNYPGTLKMIHPPGKSRRYAEVSQIIEDLPRFVRFETDTVSAPLPGQTEGETVKKGTVVEVTKVLSKRYSTLQYLECTAGNKQKYLFRRDALVNCTAIPDDRKYTLQEALTSGPLPRVVKFENATTADDVVACFSMGVNNVFVMTYGPMQLLRSEKRRFAVGWVRNKVPHEYRTTEQHNFKVTLIPDSRWDTEMVKVYRFNMTSDKQMLMDKTFPLCEDPRFVEDKLYIVQQKETLVTWLNSGIIVEEEKVQPSSYPDNMDDYGYCIPGPAIPPRVPIVKDIPGKTVQSKVHPDILKKVAEKMKLGFGQVHRQLSILIRHEDKPEPVESCTSKKGPLHRDASEPVERRESTERPLKEIPREELDPEKEYRVYEVVPEITENKKFQEPETKKYGMLNISDKQIIMKENQTTKDFCKYTVRQVSECFRICALAEFGTICAQHKLDGAFLAHYNLQDLKNEPFHLTGFKVKKVKLIIHDGWRPVHESLTGK